MVPISLGTWPAWKVAEAWERGGVSKLIDTDLGVIYVWSHVKDDNGLIFRNMCPVCRVVMVFVMAMFVWW